MSTIEHIEPAAADALVATGAYLLDVRNDDEWVLGHAPAATLIPLGELAARAGELPTDRRIAVVCRSGGRSAQATEALVGAGYDAVNVAGGMQAWLAAGLPVVDDAGGPGTVG